MAAPVWPSIVDEAMVEKLLPAIQQVVADTCALELGIAHDDTIPVAIGDLSNALLIVLATVLAPLPQCATARGARLLAEAVAKELALLILDTRRLKAADAQPPGRLQ